MKSVINRDNLDSMSPDLATFRKFDVLKLILLDISKDEISFNFVYLVLFV